MGERPGGALDAHEAARQRAQEDLRQPEQDEDRREVEQQQVLGHVHEEAAARRAGRRASTSATRTAPCRRGSSPAGRPSRRPPASGGRREREHRDDHDRARARRSTRRRGRRRGCPRLCQPRGAVARESSAIRASRCTPRATIADDADPSSSRSSPAALRRLPRARPARRRRAVRALPPRAAVARRSRAASAARCRCRTRGRCPARDAPFDAAWAPSPTTGAARDAMHALKFSAARPLARGHGRADRRQRAPRAAARAPRGSLVAVPPHPARRRVRGFDPAELLARRARPPHRLAAARAACAAAVSRRGRSAPSRETRRAAARLAFFAVRPGTARRPRRRRPTPPGPSTPAPAA